VPVVSTYDRNLALFWILSDRCLWQSFVGGGSADADESTAIYQKGAVTWIPHQP
jgi:hypothetical protein